MLFNKFSPWRLVCASLCALAVNTVGAQQPDWLQAPLSKPLSEVRIGITVLHPSSNAYQAQYAATAEEYAKELGIQATIVDPQGDPSRQFSQIQNLVAQRMDALIVWPTSAVAVIPAIRQAWMAKIPVVISNSQIEEDARRFTVAWTGPDDCGQAQKAAELLGEALGGKGNIVMIMGTPGYSVAMTRDACFMETIKAWPDIVLLEKQPANWNRERAQAVMENFLTKYGKTIHGVYAHDDGMGLGALNAIRAAGYQAGDIKMTTANLFGEGYDAIQAGWHSGSVYQSPIEDARLAIQTAVQIALGQTPPREQYIPTPKISPQNLSAFPKPTW